MESERRVTATDAQGEMLKKSQERNKDKGPQSQQLSRHPHDVQRKCACSGLNDEPHKGHS
jgi:hypothetical protein